MEDTKLETLKSLMKKNSICSTKRLYDVNTIIEEAAKHSVKVEYTIRDLIFKKLNFHYYIYKFEYKKICYQKCPNGTIYDRTLKMCYEIISLNNYIIKDIINSFPTKYINISHLDDTIWINKSYLRINISRSGKNVINNHTKIDVLEDCENKLKEYYNIPENASLIKLIFEKKEEGTNSFKPEYEIRYLLNGSYIKLKKFI